MAEINLLPIDLSNKSETSQAVNSVKKGILFLSGIFLVIIVFGIGIIIFLSNQLTNSLERQQNIKAEIKKLESVEQKLILTKDRLEKIKLAGSDINSGDSLETLNPVINSLPSNVTLNDVDIQSDGSTLFTVVSQDSIGMATFLNNMVTNGVYKELTLHDFIFDPSTGYKITLTNP